MATTSNKPFRIGVMLEAVQLVDIMGIDILGNLSRSYMDQVKHLDPKIAALEEHAVNIEFLYIATTLEPADVTPGIGLKFVPTVTYDDCPRDLDLVLIGGPLLSHRPPQADKFMKEAWTKTRVWMTTCVGSLWLASTGLLDGKKCTTNRGFLGAAEKVCPGVEWLDQRWVVEEKPYDGADGKGELWTSGAAGAGLDMIANYCLEKYDKEFVTAMSLEGLDLDPKRCHGQFYAK
ncbi:class I glutamine amidotransferase-like protein [Apodospora peruviana]|uniref:Class I glutamine amidotransferase-like protein n=1 Tax=Apodospora peruviana TaxID=516989 RepID=A0AAE0IPZ7_9PEZI|nr:class I glutamine amidotransferase-like protein [Apodospora peruviana]